MDKMDYKIETKSIYELGQRTNQEDSIYPAMDKADDNSRLFILCDGMGGHEHGEVASATVCKVMSKYVIDHYNFDQPFTDQIFEDALNAAFDALDEIDVNEDKKKMGTTLTFLLLHAEGAFVAHIGDSRIYQIRPSRKEILFKSHDHSLVNDLIAVGELTEEEAKTSKQKNIITRAIQPHQERRSFADIAHITDVETGDWFLLCSDGMLEELEDQNLINILSDEETTIDEKAEIMRQVSKDSRDNHSAHLIHVLMVVDHRPWFKRIFG